MDTILSFLGNGLSGGLFGILGGLGTAWLKMKADEKTNAFKIENKKLDHKNNLQVIEAETAALIAEVNANVRRDQIMMEGQADVEESKGRNAAILKLSENYVKSSMIEEMMFNKNTWTAWMTIPIAILITLVHGVVDISRTLVRVLVTYGSVVFSAYVTYMAFQMYQELGVKITADQLYDIIQTMLKLLTFTTSTVIGFWFMDKSMSRKFQNNN